MGKHKEWRKLAKKARRKRIRQKLAQVRDENEDKERVRHELSPSYKEWFEVQQKAQEFQAQEEARIAAEQEARWLKAEEEAQQQWKKLQEKLSLAREERVKQAERIKEEWEREQNKLKELKEKKEKEEEEKLKKQQELHTEINDFIENGGVVPEGMKTKFETNPMKPLCPFFHKTGACRFKDTCSRNHIRPGISRVLLVPNFYSHYSLQQNENEHGSDSSLEFESRETYDHFKEFFYDVLPEMEKYGYVRQFKVCCNHEQHLRGNVYIEYSTCRGAVRSYQQLYGRWYGGKQLHVEFCNIESWKSAICGLFGRQKCPKGSSCNFLHVFGNPNNLFASADKDLHRTPPDTFEDDNFESDTRNWRWSESPERFPNSETVSHRRSRERKRRNGHRSNKSTKPGDSRSSRRKRKHRSQSRSDDRSSSKTSNRNCNSPNTRRN